MTFTPEREALLSETLKSSNVKQLKGNDYIEGWHAIAEANRIFGYGGWSYEIVQLESKSQHTNQNNTMIIGYICRVRVTVDDVTREDVGFGTGMSKTDISACHEGASKEAVTDALKRALKSFGNQFGLALYDKKKANVEAEQRPPPRSLFDTMVDALATADNLPFIESIWADPNFKQDKLMLSPDEQRSIEQAYETAKSKLQQKAA